MDDIRPLLSPEVEPQWNLEEALSLVKDRLFPCLIGEAWKGENFPLINSEREIKQRKNELLQNNTALLPSLGEILTKKRGDELVQSVMEILAAGANINDISFNGHRPLQLLIKARLDPRKKLELVKYMIDLGADIHSADNSGLTPYQVAISEEHKAISDFLHARGARRISPPGIGYAQHYKLYGKIP